MLLHRAEKDVEERIHDTESDLVFRRSPKKESSFDSTGSFSYQNQKLKNKIWDEESDIKLKKLAKKHNYKWKLISREFNNKSAAALKYRYE